MTARFGASAVLLALLAACAAASTVGARDADLSTAAATERSMAGVVGDIHDRMQRSVGQLSRSAPVLTSEFRTLEHYVDEYLRRFGSKVSVVNPIWALTNACNEKAVQRDYERVLPVGKQHNAYVEVNNRLKEKYDKLIQLSAYDALAQGLGLMLFPPQGGLDIFTALGMQAIEDCMTPKYRPLGADRLRATGIPRLAAELKPDQERLLAVLKEVPANKNDVARICKEAQRLAAACEGKAGRIYAELLQQHQEAKRDAAAVCAHVVAVATEVDRILQRRARVALCEVSPSPMALPRVHAHCPLILRLVYDSGLRQEARYDDVVFEQDEPPVIRLYPNPGTGHAVAQSVAEGTREVRIRSKADGKLLGSFRVEVGSAPAQPPPAVAPPAVPSNMPPIVSGGTAGRPSVGFVLSPANPPYPLGTTLTFTEDVDRKTPSARYTYVWRVDNREIHRETLPGDSGRRSTARHTFEQAGPHYIQLELTSSLPGQNDAIIRNVFIDPPPDLSVDFEILTPLEALSPGDAVDVRQRCKNARDVTEYRWHLDGRFVGSGESIRVVLPDPGPHEIKLGTRRGSNFDEGSARKTVTVGEAALRRLGTWINQFMARKEPSGLELSSRYWIGGDGKWSEWSRFQSVGAVDGFAFCQGEQADGYNTGFLVYVPAGMRTPRLQFAVYRFDFEARRGVVKYSGTLPMHNKTPDPASLQFVEVHSRNAVIQWRATDGATGRARIWKNEASDPNSRNMFVKGGVEDLGCTEGQRTGALRAVPLGEWQAHATGESTASKVGGALAVDAMKSGGAWFTVPRPYDFKGDYSVQFEFQLREGNGHWLTLYSDGMIYLTTGWGVEMVHHQPGLPWDQTAPLHKFDLNRWYRLQLDASPARGSVDVYVDGKKVGSATGLKPVIAWHTLSPRTPDPGTIFVGNADAPGDVNAGGTYNCGRGTWRRFEVRAAPIR